MAAACNVLTVAITLAVDRAREITLHDSTLLPEKGSLRERHTRQVLLPWQISSALECVVRTLSAREE